MSDDEKSDKGTHLPQFVRDTWLGMLGFWSSAEGEVQKLTRGMLESLGLPETSEQLSVETLKAEIQARIRKNRDEFEKRIEDGVRAAVAKVRAPIDTEMAAQRARIERLTQRLEERRRRRRDKT